MVFSIPEGFSPNSDGINDLFVIKGIENYPTLSVNIYNRWGSLVFEASPYLNNWNGKSNSGVTVGGDDLPIGTYFYIIDLGNGSPILKGTIYLNK
ncbi:MAG: gliding motility-associated C-terminal domain-containing protein [Bacteroidia bacterium]